MLTAEQHLVVRDQRLTVIAHCAGRSKSIIVRCRGDRRLFYLSPSGLFRRCR